MKKLILLTCFIGILFYTPTGFSQTKSKSKTIKYDNGNKYTGETQVVKKPNSKKQRIKSGQGILYYSNGDVLEGTFASDVPSKGTLHYTNGNTFEGTFFSGKPRGGTLTFKTDGVISIGAVQWHYPANSHFTGAPHNRVGTFDCALTSEHGDIYNGEIAYAGLHKGKIEYANRDVFTGSFYTYDSLKNAPNKGTYKYASDTHIEGWCIPEGCTFTGYITEFTGIPDKELTDKNGNTFIGRFKSGVPDEGTVKYAATGEIETGKWINGLSPKAYQRQQDSLATVRAEVERRQEVERKRIEQEKIKTATDELNQYINEYTTLAFGSRNFTRIYSSKAEGAEKDLYEKFRPALLPLLQQLINKELYHNGKNIGICKSIFWDENSLMATYEKAGVQVQNRIKYVEMNHNFLSHCRCECQTPSDLKLNCAVSISFPASDWGDSDGPVFRLMDIHIAKSRLKDYYYKKFGPHYGEKIINGKIELGMPIAVVQAIKGEGKKSEFISDWAPHVVELSYGWSESYTFRNGKLNSITK